MHSILDCRNGGPDVQFWKQSRTSRPPTIFYLYLKSVKRCSLRNGGSAQCLRSRIVSQSRDLIFTMTETSSLRYSTSTFSTLCSISLGSSTFCSSTPPSSRGSYSLLSDRIHQIDQRQTQASSWRIHIRLSQGEFIYVYHKERSNGNIAWRCHQYSQPANTRCSAAAVTTGTSSSSTLKYARDHNHPPSAGRVGVYKVKNNLKTVSSQDRTAKPHKIVLDNLRNVTELTNN